MGCHLWLLAQAINATFICYWPPFQEARNRILQYIRVPLFSYAAYCKELYCTIQIKVCHRIWYILLTTTPFQEARNYIPQSVYVCCHQDYFNTSPSTLNMASNFILQFILKCDIEFIYATAFVICYWPASKVARNRNSTIGHLGKQLKYPCITIQEGVERRLDPDHCAFIPTHRTYNYSFYYIFC